MSEIRSITRANDKIESLERTLERERTEAETTAYGVTAIGTALGVRIGSNLVGTLLSTYWPAAAPLVPFASLAGALFGTVKAIDPRTKNQAAALGAATALGIPAADMISAVISTTISKISSK
jgi:hypothetical protein